MATLTISRQHGSNGKEIGKEIAREIGYVYVDREQILKDIRTKGQDWEKWEKEFEEHHPTIWEKYDWSFRGFVALQQSLILDYALKDKALIMGRGGNFLLKDIPCVLKVRIEAPLDARIDHVQNRENVDRATASLMIKKMDKESKGFIGTVYGADWNVHTYYDIIFNTAIQSTDIVMASLKAAIPEKDRFNTEEVRKMLRMKAASAAVKAGILTNSRFFIPTLDIRPSGDTIVLRGVVHNPKEFKSVEDEARRLAGSVPVKCELNYR
ncbi:MAG: cytidylate kinase-like family protein [Proteobacteria bacterium]|nr:cytidylate kinase-like family protein [Pseudomonadota bacterium]